jgi:hypothetical protein
MKISHTKTFGDNPQNTNRIYERAQNNTKEQILQIVERNIFEELATLPFDIGENYPDWKFAQDICVRLTNHTNALIRANAIMGFAYIARTKGKLEKHIIKPIILRELRNNAENKGQIIDAIDDINRFLKWKLASKILAND